jgi:hypothetical protein
MASRVGKGALAPCPPSVGSGGCEWWARGACHRAARSRGPVGFAHPTDRPRIYLPAARICPGDARSSALSRRGRRECRVPLHPGGSCAQMRKKMRTSSTGTTEHAGIPCAMLDDLFRALPGVPGFLATILPGSLTRKLTPASGCQDHTASSDASRAPRRGAAYASIATRLTFRDDRPERPSWRGGLTWNVILICRFRQVGNGATKWHDGQFAHGGDDEGRCVPARTKQSAGIP